MSLSLEIQAIGDELVEAFSEHRLASRLDFILERLDAAAERAAALEARKSPARTLQAAGGGAEVIDFIKALKEARR